MNIGIVTTWFDRGASYVSRQFMEILQQQNNVYIYARGGEAYAQGSPKWDFSNVYWSKKREVKKHIYGPTYICKSEFQRWLEGNKIEVVLFNEQQWFPPVAWCKDLGVKTIAYIDYYREDTIPLYDIYDCVICNTKRHAFAFRHHANMQYLKWGTNVELYKPVDKTNNEVCFFHSAGMAPYRKGTDILLKAFHEARNRKNAKLIIHTQVPLNDSFDGADSIIQELSQEGSLEIIHKTVSAPGLYYLGDIYVYPARLDGIGLSLIEAISCGLPVITTDNAPMNEFVENKHGMCLPVEYLYCRKDAYYWPMSICSQKELTSCIEDVIFGKYDLKQMRKEAREYAERELDYTKNFKKLNDIVVTLQFNPHYAAVKKMIYPHVPGYKIAQRIIEECWIATRILLRGKH